MTIWAELQYFYLDEFDHPAMMNPDLLRKLDDLRAACGFALHITSDFRPGDPKQHGMGNAVDLRAHDGVSRRAIVENALLLDFPGIGVYDRHVHVDVRTTTPVIWGGKSE